MRGKPAASRTVRLPPLLFLSLQLAQPLALRLAELSVLAVVVAVRVVIAVAAIIGLPGRRVLVAFGVFVFERERDESG